MSPATRQAARLTGAILQGILIGVLLYAAIVLLLPAAAQIQVFRYQGF